MPWIDRCPHCQMPLQIICVKFQWTGTEILSACPNCAELAADGQVSASLEAARKRVDRIPVFRTELAVMDALNSRFKNLVTFMVAALVVAALLRHTIHVYGGVAPADIRLLALVLLAPIVWAMVAFTARRSRN